MSSSSASSSSSSTGKAEPDERADKRTKGGQLVFSGNASWSMVGKTSKTNDFDGVEGQILYSYEKLKPLVGVKIRTVISGPTAATCMAIGLDGQCYTWGRNNHGQLGHGNLTNIYNPLAVDIAEPILGGACGANHTLVFSESGNLYSCGSGKCGQLGVSKKPEFVKKFTQVEMPAKVTAVAAGREFSMAVDQDGEIYSFGHPEYGCLGNGSEFKSLERAGKYTFGFLTVPAPIAAFKKKFGADIKIVDVSCGAKHTCALDSQGRIYTWGFGAYGRLGHKDNKDQYEPVPVALFSEEPPPKNPDLPDFLQHQKPTIRASRITCGGTCTYVIAAEPFSWVYMFGITKKTGEAQMTPELEEQCSGWKATSLAVGPTSVHVASDRVLMSWGPSPTFGELGYGTGDGIPKSSTKSREVTCLKGSNVLQVASGMAHSLAIVDDEDEVSKTRLDALPEFHPEEVDPEITKAAEAMMKEKAKAKREKARKKKEDLKSKKATSQEGAEAVEGENENAEGNGAGDDDGEPAAKKRKEN